MQSGVGFEVIEGGAKGVGVFDDDGVSHGGRACFNGKNGEKVEADLISALECIGDLRQREPILLVQAENRETNLKNDETALQAFDDILEGKARFGGADEYAALQGKARLKQLLFGSSRNMMRGSGFFVGVMDSPQSLAAPAAFRTPK